MARPGVGLSRLALLCLLAGTALACQGPAAGQPSSAPAATDSSPARDSAAATPPPIKVRLSQPVAGLGYTSIYVASRNGYFADEGLDLEVLTLTTGGGPDT